MIRLVAYHRRPSRLASPIGDPLSNAIKDLPQGYELISSLEDDESRADRPWEKLREAVRQCIDHNADLLVVRHDPSLGLILFIIERESSTIGVVTSIEQIVKRESLTRRMTPRTTMHIAQLLCSTREHHGAWRSAQTKRGLEKRRNSGLGKGNPNPIEGRLAAAAANRKKADEFVMKKFSSIAGADEQSDNYSQLAAELNERGIRTQLGKNWTPTGVSRFMARATNLGLRIEGNGQVEVAESAQA